jgi:nitrate reductase gamma subunit
MTPLLYGTIWGGLVLFVAGSLVRLVTYARAPLHLRWELHPLPQQGHARRVGGHTTPPGQAPPSPHRGRVINEWRYMLPEMLLMKSLRDHNRSLWRLSFPFHFGLYLVAVGVLLLIVTAAPGWSPGGPSTPAAGYLLERLALGCGGVGILLTLGGAAALLGRRLCDPSLRGFTAGADILHLLWFLGAFGLIAAGRLTTGHHQAGVAAVVAGLLRFDTTVAVNPLMGVGMVLGALLLAYIPTSHMSHYIGKYFTWHAVRWDDAPNRVGGEIERRVIANLSLRPTWAARHTGGGRSRSWAELAASSAPFPEHPSGEVSSPQPDQQEAP